ncbi:FIG001196: Membrane protein YedZ [hydrothermal vent metagenome]|uniref:FIG001196: Membrane protein YedZ n=1 Tax=hydrothermal vent metagenome TaxID=652676 RepID=A0A3B1E6V6_9ZZZZ
MNNATKKYILIAVLVVPFLYLLYKLILVGANDPIKYIFTLTGTTAMFMLIATTMLSVIKLTKYRKILGLGAFCYALLHFVNFIILDAELDIEFIIKESLDKPFIYLGMLSFFILAFMATTSTKNGFKKHSKKHKIIYLAILLVIVHFIMGQKTITIEHWWYLLIFIVVIGVKGKILLSKDY